MERTGKALWHVPRTRCAGAGRQIVDLEPMLIPAHVCMVLPIVVAAKTDQMRPSLP